MGRITWASYGGFSGWAHYGTRPAAELLPGTDFWAKAVRVAAAAEGGKVDAVQCYDAAIMTAGPLQGTARFHYLQHLLGHCREYEPEGFIKCMDPVMYVDGEPLVRVEPYDKVPGGFAFYIVDDGAGFEQIATTEQRLREIFFLGGNGRAWNEAQKAHAKKWVECLAELLGDHGAFDSVVAQHSGWLLRRFFTEPARQKIAGANLNNFERDRLTAVHCAFALNHPTSAARILTQVLAIKPASKRPADQYLQIASTSTPNTFPKRVRATRARMRIEWPDG